MLLHQIIELNDQILTGQTDCRGISFEEISKYRKSLTTYYRNEWPIYNDPVFVATFVTNSICAGVIAPSCELGEVYDVLTSHIEDEEERQNEIELLSCQTTQL